MNLNELKKATLEYFFFLSVTYSLAALEFNFKVAFTFKSVLCFILIYWLFVFQFSFRNDDDTSQITIYKNHGF
jgi:hypothetical protein